MFFWLFGKGRSHRPNSKKINTPAPNSKKHMPHLLFGRAVRAGRGGGTCLSFCCLGGGVFMRLRFGRVVLFLFCCFGRAVSMLCLLFGRGKFLFLLFGWVRVFFLLFGREAPFLVGAGNGNSLTYWPAWLGVEDLTKNIKKQTTTKQENKSVPKHGPSRVTSYLTSKQPKRTRLLAT